jgi:opacity protein-like surface antigen
MESSNKVISHRNNLKNAAKALVLTSFFIAGPLLAQDFYISGIVGVNNPQNSNSSGTFINNFVSGQVTGFSSPVTFATGSPFSWETDFADGETYSLAAGYEYKSFRVELALGRSANSVTSQSDVVFGSTNLTFIDAGVLTTGNVGDTGVNTGLFLSEGGRMETTTVMLNVYHDFDFGGDLNPYVGVGVGNAEESILFRTRDGNLTRDKDNGFAWQLIAGLEYQALPSVALFGQYRYFQAEDPELGLKLLPGSINVENKFQAFEVGLRFSF